MQMLADEGKGLTHSGSQALSWPCFQGSRHRNWVTGHEAAVEVRKGRGKGVFEQDSELVGGVWVKKDNL